MKKSKLVLLFFIFNFVLCFYLTKNVLADDMIFNNGFEDGVGNWKTTSSSVTFSVVTNPFFEGTQAASVSNTSSSSFGIEQIISNIQENTDYLVNGRINVLDPPPTKSFIRIAWYSSPDGSGSQIKTDDSEIISTVTDWKLLSFVAKSPVGTHSAKIRLLVSSGTAYFDNITISFNIPTVTLEPTPTDNIEPTTNNEQPTTISNIYISEVMVAPNSGEPEWVELYNNNDFDITLSDWYIDDIQDAGASPKKFNINIPAHGYGTYDLASSMFNNDGDSVRLLDSEENEIDSITYSSSQKNYSVGKTIFVANDVCSQIPSKNAANNSCVTIIPTTTTVANSPTSKPSPTVKKTPTPTKVLKKIISSVKNTKPTTHNSQPTTGKQQQATEDILGAATEISMPQTSSRSIANTLTILAFSYSILTIISIITKLTLHKKLFVP